MLDAVQKRCPALTSLFNKFYALDAMCLLNVEGGTKVIWSTEGSRMGCVLGSFGFGLTAQDIYEAVQDKFPSTVSKGLTDDFTIGLPPPDSDEDHQNLWDECGSILNYIAAESKARANLELNFTKCHVLAPPGINDPQINSLPKGTSIERDGLRLAGAPIGKDNFCSNYIAEQVREIKKKIDALEGIDPQTGFTLLRRCIVPTLTYFAQVTPPQITMPHLIKYDEHITQRAMQILNPKGNRKEQQCSKSRMQRAIKKLQLPIKHQGAGITKAARIGPIAFYASVAASQTTDPDLAMHKDGLKRFCENTHQMVANRIGKQSSESLSIEALFPRNLPTAMIDSTFYVELYRNQPTLKLQKMLSICAHSVAARELKLQLSQVSRDVSESDIIIEHSKSSSARILRAPLSQPTNRMTEMEFITWMRYFLRIPPLNRIGNAKFEDELGYVAESCTHHHQKGIHKILDAHANHANSGCPSATAGRSLRHTLIEWTIYNAAKEADLVVHMEPKTRNLLCGQFSTEQCQSLFPKTANKKVKEEIENIKKEIEATNALEYGHERRIREAKLQSQCRMLQKQHLTKGLRIDVQATDPISSDEYWIDVTCIHPTCKSRIKKESAHIKNKIMEEEKRRKKGENNPTSNISGKAVLDQTNNKHNTYEPLISMARKQKNDGIRDKEPKFLAVVITTNGEFGPETIQTIELLTRAYSNKIAKEGPQDDGSTVQDLTAEFRNGLKDALQVAVARGLARMIYSAGWPTYSCKKYINNQEH